LVGIVFGVVLYRADFCMAGIFRDIFLIKDYALLRSLFLLVVLSAILFHFARLSGLVAIYPPPPYGYPSLATLMGGLLFGIGMVLAGGCVVGTLYKMAGGNLTNLIAFLGIVGGSLVYAEFHQFWKAFRADSTITQNILLSEISPGGGWAVLAAISVASLIVFLKWKSEGKWNVKAYAQGYLQPWKAAAIIAVLNTAALIFAGWPMGITTAYAKMGAYVEKLFMPSHVARLSYFSQDSVTVEFGSSVVSGGAGPHVDIISVTELALVAGIVAGAFLTAVFLREFRIYGLPPRRQAVSAFAGGILLAFGARVASGCNVKFVLGALPLLSLQAVFFVAAMVGGAYLGAKIIKRVV
jgi:hypothetical protein